MTSPQPRRHGPERRRFGIFSLALALVSMLSCGRGDTTAPTPPEAVSVVPESTLLVGVGETLAFVARASGAPLSTGVEWSTNDPAVATVSAGGVATAVSTGTTRVVATVGSVSGSAVLEVWVPPEVASYEAGQTHLGRASYVEYVVGELPVVIGVPHGGLMTPEEIPDRLFGRIRWDRDTQDLSRRIRNALIERTGGAPHLIVSRLHRVKLDPNREIVEAAQGSVFAENAWYEFQGFIEVAKDIVTRDFGSGLYLDIHGHEHDIDRIELGYLLFSSELSLSDAFLNHPALVANSSVRALAGTVGITFAELIRGPNSLGTLLAEAGVRTVPSAADPNPGGAAYFRGGYNTYRHGSTNGGTISAIQIEHQWPGLRDTEQNQEVYSAILADALVTFLEVNFALTVTGTGVARTPHRSPQRDVRQ